MQYSGHEDLNLIDKYLKNYNESIINLFIKKINIEKNFQVLDFGAGIGSLAEIFHKRTSIKPECFEICEAQQKILSQKQYKLQNEFLDQEKYNLIYSSNVLEHIEQDNKVVGDLKKMLKKDGYLVIFVPAFNFLFSDADIKFQHFRRYNEKMLKDICNNNGLTVESIKFFDSFGFFILAFLKFFRFKVHKNMSSKNLIFYDKFIIKISIFLDLIFKKICGKNIILIARKTAK